MNGDNGVPLFFGHVDEHAVTQDACVIDHCVQIAEGLDGGVDEALCALPRSDVVAVRYGLAAHALDLIDHLLGWRLIAAGSIDVATEVVDDDLGALACQA